MTMPSTFALSLHMADERIIGWEIKRDEGCSFWTIASFFTRRFLENKSSFKAGMRLSASRGQRSKQYGLIQKTDARLTDRRARR